MPAPKFTLTLSPSQGKALAALLASHPKQTATTQAIAAKVDAAVAATEAPAE